MLKRASSCPAASEPSNHYTGFTAIGLSIILCAGRVQCAGVKEHSGPDTLENLH
jgi:hypothetical protein